MNTKDVRTVTVTYADGETETFDPIVGFHRTMRNNKAHDTNLDNVWIDHEIRWSSKDGRS